MKKHITNGEMIMLKRLTILIIALLLGVTVVSASNWWDEIDEKDITPQMQMCDMFGEYIQLMCMNYYYESWDENALRTKTVPAMTKEFDKQLVLHLEMKPGYTRTQKFLEFQEQAIRIALAMDDLEIYDYADSYRYAEKVYNKFFDGCVAQ